MNSEEKSANKEFDKLFKDLDTSDEAGEWLRALYFNAFVNGIKYAHK